MGALHPVLFFAVMYVVVLFLSIFICTSIFNSINDSEASSDFSPSSKTEQTARTKTLLVAVASAVSLRN